MVEIERLPAPQSVALAGVSVATVHLTPFKVSATAKLRLATQTAKADTIGALDIVAAL
jgi:hypothetical protein